MVTKKKESSRVHMGSTNLELDVDAGLLGQESKKRDMRR